MVQYLTFGLVFNALLIGLALYIAKETWDYAWEKRWPNVLFGIVAVLALVALVLWRMGVL